MQRSNIMALINCPECNKLISNTTKVCPHCGFKHKKTNIFAIGIHLKNKKFLSIGTSIILAVIFFILILNSIPMYVYINGIRFSSNDTLNTVMKKLDKKNISHSTPDYLDWENEEWITVYSPKHVGMTWNYVEFTFNDRTHEIKEIHFAVDSNNSKKNLRQLYHNINSKPYFHYENYSDSKSSFLGGTYYKVDDWYWHDWHRNKVTLKYASLFDRNNLIYSFNNFN